MDELNAHCPDWYMLVTDKYTEKAVFASDDCIGILRDF